MWPFSYSRCATDIVYLAEKPSLRDASCCSVVVRNGAYGERRYGLRSTDLTLNGTPSSRPASSPASSRWTTPARDLAGLPGCPRHWPSAPARYSRSALRSSPVGAKSRPCATRRPSTAISRAGKDETSSAAALAPSAILVKIASRSQ